MLLPITQLKELLSQSVHRYISEKEAQYFVDEVIESHVRKTPRSNVLRGVIGDIKTWAEHTDSAIVKEVDLPGFTKYDCNHLGPSVKILEIHEDIMRKADTNGIAMISVVNSGGFHTLHLWTEGLAKKGYFALVAFNGGPDAVIPFNGTKGILGTNPIAFGFPGDKGDISIDMATSEIPFFEIKQAMKTGKKLPPNSAVDSLGNLTDEPTVAMDAEEVSNLTPIGNTYKGYNLNYVLEIMTSALIGAKVSSEMSGDYIAEEHGGFIVVMAIDKLTNKNTYATSVESINKKIRAQKPRVGVERVEVPGDRNLKRKKDLGNSLDIELDDALVEDLRKLASV